MLTRESILSKATALPVATVSVPEWGGDVFVRSLTARERDEFEVGCMAFDSQGRSKPHLENYRGRFAAVVIGNAQGGRIFSDDDAGMLGELPAAVLDKILDAARKHNGMARDSASVAEKN